MIGILKDLGIHTVSGGDVVVDGKYYIAGLVSGSYDAAFRVALGDNAGTNITSGSSNIALGPLTDLPNATANYQINIGNVIYGTGGSYWTQWFICRYWDIIPSLQTSCKWHGRRHKLDKYFRPPLEREYQRFKLWFTVGNAVATGTLQFYRRPK